VLNRAARVMAPGHGRAQHFVVGGQRHLHLIRVGLPPTSRPLDIGEQKRHRTRWGHRPISGHPRSMAQATRSHLEHRGMAMENYQRRAGFSGVLAAYGLSVAVSH
jgi:hypothetical protein